MTAMCLASPFPRKALPSSLTKELLEVKRVQIRAGRANEAVSKPLKIHIEPFQFHFSPFIIGKVLVKRLAERLQKDLDRQENENISFLKRTKRKNCLSRATGLRGYQGEFTFCGLEKHLFSELRRFRTSSQDDLHERELVKLSTMFSDARLVL